MSTMYNVGPYMVKGTYGFNSHSNPVAWMMGAVTTLTGSNLERNRVRAYGKFQTAFPSRATGVVNMRVIPARVGKRCIVLPDNQPTWSYLEI